MKAQSLIDRREQVAENAFVELALWRVATPVPPTTHGYKYRLAYVVNAVCVVRFDNERGKGDHKHIGTVETAVVFVDVDQLLADFMSEITRWNNENRDL
jgi:hypothetical protein